MTETLGDVLKVGTDATEEVAKIGVKAIGAAPSILEQKIAFAQAQWPKINNYIRKFIYFRSSKSYDFFYTRYCSENKWNKLEGRDLNVFDFYLKWMVLTQEYWKK